ncbi:MMPL family transporter [Micromonospora sp. NBC_00389]|uniref:MMPL family transporter n=1 Tax=Micromonospora sp. NBC_00389 TaxID=2903586 RepID=UPI002E1A2757
MFSWWGRTVVQVRWWVLAGALALAVVGGGWGTGVFGALSSGGFDAPGSESAQTAQRITVELGAQSPDLVVLYSNPVATVDASGLRDPVTATLAALRQRPEVAKVVDFYDTGSPLLVSTDRHATYAAITLRATSDDAKLDAYRSLRPALPAPGVDTQVGGVVALMATADELTEQDIARGEAIAMPIVLILLVIVFGGLVAAGMPLLIGILAILGALTTTRLIATVTDVSTFAVNSITLLGLGMAIDYSLFMVSRFREELAAGHDTPQAVAGTMATAGRTVLVSGATIALALSSLLIFPQIFLRSMGIGGMAAVLVAMLGALTVLPALLAILGPRINALRVPVPWRRRHPAASTVHGGWAKLAHAVMRRPLPYVVAVLAVLAALALPFGHARFGGADERVLPPGTPARVVAERIATQFPAGATTGPIQVLIEAASSAQVADVVGRVRALPGVTGAQVAASRGDTTLVVVSYTGEPTGDVAYDTVRAIRDLPTSVGVQMLVGGRPAQDIDLVASLASRLPWMAAIMAAVTLVLLFLAFGSLLLPVKAVLMNLVSIGASFGAVVWVFQDGHLASWLGFTPTGYLEPNLPILILAVLFGLATDYEVFLLSRIREQWDATGDNTTAVATGMQHTGRIITAAALLLVIVVAGFTAGQVVFAKLIGVGMITAIVVDAALVRTLLVPASMRLLGRWNWWAPRPLAALYRRYGIGEDRTPKAQSHPAALADAGEPR